MIKAAIYCRVSSDMQAEEELPIQGQAVECERFCQQKGWQIVHVYKDEGFTGRNTDRPAFVEMLADAKKKTFNKIVVWKGSRIARNVQDRLATDSILGRLGIDLVSLNEPEMEGSTRVLMLPIMAAMDEYQSYIIAEDTLRGLKMLARQGYSTGGVPPKGYRVKRVAVGLKKNGEPLFRTTWEPDPVWSEQALRAFEMLAEGRTAREIIETTHIINNDTAISSYFRNSAFIGERVYNVQRRIKGRRVKVPLDDPEIIRVPDAHEAIIPRELFERCQVMLTRRRRGPGQLRNVRHDFILSGALWCERHNCAITGSGNGRKRYYVCESFRRGGRKVSNCPSLNKEALETFVLGVIKDKVFTVRRVRECMHYLTKSAITEDKHKDDTEARLRQQIARVDLELQRFYKAISDGIPADSLVTPMAEKRQIRDSLTNQLDQLQNAKARATGDLTGSMIQEVRTQVLDVLDNGSPDIQRKFIRSCVQRIKIAGDSVTINLNVPENPAKLPRANAEGGT
ncbi:MAG: recombinase family protein [Dehalococcoidia bacterium]